MINLQSLFASFIKANSPQANSASRLGGRARAVAVFVSLFMGIGLSKADGGSININQDTKIYISSIANYQLTDKQYKCHQEIIYRESRWDERAIGNVGGSKQAYGLYQLKIASMRTAHPELQFWKYWQYVAHRYGVTEYDEPMYCAALTHLKTKGWQ